MRQFAALYETLDRTTSTNAKVDALVRYFSAIDGTDDADAADGAWGLYVLTGRKLKRLVVTSDVRRWAAEAAGLSPWLFDECYETVGDLAETIALLLAGRPRAPVDASLPATDPKELPGQWPLARWLGRELPMLRLLPPEAQRPRLVGWWHALEPLPLFLLTKLMTGGLRVGASTTLVTRALAQVAGVEQATMTHLLMGSWRPSAATFRALVAGQAPDATPEAMPDTHAELEARWLEAHGEPSAAGQQLSFPAVPRSAPKRPGGPEAADAPASGSSPAPPGGNPATSLARPYPFYLASPLPAAEGLDAVAGLGPVGDWLVEWKWDGIRAQLVLRGGEVFLWSRGEELLTDRFVELVAAARELPAAAVGRGLVLDGEILCYRDDVPMGFATLQQRIGRTKLTPKILREAPASFVAYDLLEQDGRDVRGEPQHSRRAQLELMAPHTNKTLRLSPPVQADSWEELAALRQGSRARGVEGLMLKRLTSPYGTGRQRGDWWKWKIDPLTIDAVLVYAQLGHGRRAHVYTDYTFGVWDGDALVPVAKAYSGLDDAEIDELDRWVRAHRRERFGPVRAVEPHHVFELAFDSAALSSRHRAGVALRFPRIARWRRDKRPAQADTLESVKALIGGARAAS